jgi:hypothetical protein
VRACGCWLQGAIDILALRRVVKSLGLDIPEDELQVRGRLGTRVAHGWAFSAQPMASWRGAAVAQLQPSARRVQQP